MKLSRVQTGLLVFATLNVALSAFAFSELLALGDQKYSSQPREGYIFACRQQQGGGGAFRDGPWIQGNVWQPSQKINVQGNVSWDSNIQISLEGNLRRVRANNLPKHPTGIFPVQSTDPAFQYDRNPNQIRAQNILFELPAKPSVSQNANCIGGEVGFALSGALIFNGMDATGRDALAHEIQDNCQGHPQRTGQYHYHGYSPCMNDTAKSTHSDLLGYAFDGFGIYGLLGEDGKPLKNADLDQCHGHTHQVVWDGQKLELYHYHFTSEFPYSVGCYRGKSINYRP